MGALLVIWLLAFGTLWVAFRINKWCRAQARWWRVLPRGLLVFFTLLTMFAVTETVFRYFLDITDSGIQSRIARRWVDRHVRHNPKGFRDRTHALEPLPNRFRVAILGDSMVFGIGTDDPEDRFANRLEKSMTEASGVTTEVIKMALPGWSTRQQLEYFRENGVRYKPDLVILAYFINDIQGIDPSEPQFEFRRHWLTDFFTTHFYSLDFFDCQYSPARIKATHELDAWFRIVFKNEKVLALHGQDLAKIQEISQAQDSQFVAVILPVPALMADGQERNSINATFRRLMEEHNIPYLDLWEKLKDYPHERMRVSAWDRHYSLEGNRIVADAIHECLESKGLFPKRAQTESE